MPPRPAAGGDHRLPTDLGNLICLCPKHHRELHAGEFRIEGDPDLGAVRFLDARGSPIEPPGTGPPTRPDRRRPSSFRPPDGERMQLRDRHDGDMPGLFAPVVPVPDDAPPLDKVLSLTGRDPGWSPA